MKTDIYTKSVLTLIAAALCTIAVQNMNLFPEAKAAGGINSFASVPVNADGSINVRMVDVMDVNLSRIGGSSVYGAIPVNLKEMAGHSFYGAMPVNIKEVSGSSVSSYIPVNIQAVDGSTLYGGAIPVKTK